MCGVFGLVRARQWAADRCDRCAEALFALGLLAEERGVDAAGLAVRGPLDTVEDCRTPRADVSRFTDTRVDGWRVVKRRGAFSGLAAPNLAQDLRDARIVLGHTRWATQGGDRVVNASPLTVGPIIGTHNGHVATSLLRARLMRGTRLIGQTDTEVLLAALAQTDGSAPEIQGVLAAAHGRVALVWADRRRPHGVWLARAALSPLAVAGDKHGGLWWASNPEWLRRIDHLYRLGLYAPRMVREGTLLRVVAAQGGSVKVHRAGSFVPTARDRDRRLDFATWRGFTLADRAEDMSGLIHRLSTPVLSPQRGRAPSQDWDLPAEHPWDRADWTATSPDNDPTGSVPWANADESDVA